MKDTQADKILAHMRDGRPITPITALQLYGCFRLAARIKDIRNRGHNVACRIVRNNDKHWAEYRLEA